MNIYLDNAATTSLSKETKGYITSILDIYGNPSSIHSVGQQAKQIINDARKSVRRFINASTDESSILFTPSGSASNSLFIKSFDSYDYTIFYSPIAHKSVLKAVESLSYSHKRALKVDNQGFIDLDDFEQGLYEYIGKPVVVIDYANSEIGTIQDVKQIIKITHKHGGICYIDCTGSIPTILLDAKKLDADAVGFSAHKLGGLKGTGVLYKRKSLELKPLIYGSQEQGLCGGTENIIGIAALGKAVEQIDYSSISSQSRDYVYNFIRDEIPDSHLIGATISSGKRLPCNLYVVFDGIEGESLLMLLDINNVYVSTGSACSSRDLQASSTLKAIGLDEGLIHSGIRMSFSGKETEEELDYVCKTLKQCVCQLRSLINEKRKKTERI